MELKIKQISIDKLKPHPKNPRLIIRQDVVDGIVAGLKNGFHPSNALTVWPQNGHFIILSGHQRLEAAKKANINELPCWIRDDLNEEQAYMLLATENNQGELSPLEIGMHALNYIPKAAGGRGQKGGLSEYAGRLGKTEASVRQGKKAAEIIKNIEVDYEVLFDKTQHLSTIHALPESCWPDAVNFILKKEWSAKETQEHVKAAKEGQTDKQVAALFLGKTSRRELTRISDLKAKVFQGLSHKDLQQQWIDWYENNDPIDIKELQAKRIELEDIEAERKAEEQEKLQEQEKIKIELEKQKLPSVVLADPPWRYDFSKSDSRQIENQYPSATVDEIIDHKPETQPNCVLFLWATVAKLKEALEVMDGWGFTYKTNAIWNKQKIGMGYWFRNQHEILLVGTKGSAHPPDPDARVSSIFMETRDEHSKKPKCVYEWIEQAFPDRKKLEMYSREKRDDWLTWGNES